MLGCGPLLGLDEDATLIETDGMTPVSCVAQSDCDDSNPCTLDICAEGVCANNFIDGGPPTEQIEGDCLNITCEAGVAVTLPDDEDVPGATACASYACGGGEKIVIASPRGALCSGGSGTVCDGQGSCVGCLDDEQCGFPDTCGGAGTEQVCGCMPLGCSDLGLTCGQVSDTCHGIIDCNDSSTNGGETDVDCGGDASSCSQRCAFGQVCGHGTDCSSRFCGGGHCADQWSSAHGDSGSERVAALATDPDGSVVIVGEYNGAIDFGGGELPQANGLATMFIAKLDPLGMHVFSDAYNAKAYDVAVDSSGNIIVVGSFQGAVDFGNGPMQAGENPRAFVVKLDNTGKVLWQRDLPGSITSTGAAVTVAVDAMDDILVAGEFSGDIGIDNDLFSELGGGDIFILKLNTAGSTSFARVYGDAAPDHVTDIAAAASGTFGLVGDFAGSINFGTGPLDAEGWDVYVARFSAGGDVRQVKTVGGSGTQTAGGVSFDGSDMVVAGSFEEVAELVGSSLPSSGGFDIFVLKMDGQPDTDLGRGFWGRRRSVCGGRPPRSVRRHPSSQGHSPAALPLGPATLNSLGGFDVFVSKLDLDGGVLLARAFGNADVDTLRDVSVTSYGAVLVGGEFRGSINFGQGHLVAGGGEDLFVAALAP